MLLRERALCAHRANYACRIPYTQNPAKTECIRPYGRPEGRNHVGIYLFETIGEQVESWEPERHRHVTTIANGTIRHLPSAAWRGTITPTAHTTTLSANPALRCRQKLLHGTTTQLFAGIRKTIPLPSSKNQRMRCREVSAQAAPPIPIHATSPWTNRA